MTVPTNSSSRIFAMVTGLVTLLIAVLVGSLWSKAGTSAHARVPASPALTGAFMKALCRPPDNVETVTWETRAYEEAQLSALLASSSEGERVRRIRLIYLETLARVPVGANCDELRGWVESPVGLDDIRREIAASPEARRVAQVRQMFVETLGRDPYGWDNAGLRRWVESGLSAAGIRGRLAAQKPLVGVHYFTWYRGQQGGWGNAATSVHADAPMPVLGWYSSSNPAVMDVHIGQMVDVGFDFVIVQVDAETPASWVTAHTFFSRLAGRRLRAAVMLDGLYTQTVTVKAAERVKAEFGGHPNYFMLYGKPLIMLFSVPVDFNVPDAVLRSVYWTPRYDLGANTFNSGVLYPHDWPFWASSPQPIVNGVVPVTPGYVDTHLGRDKPMQYPRNNGRMYHDQWQRALALRPELIIVYSWNEHFEQTAIEPTAAWGDRYLRWTACYIERAHSGTADGCSDASVAARRPSGAPDRR